MSYRDIKPANSPVVLRRPKGRECAGVSEWEVFDRATDRLLGVLVLDDVIEMACDSRDDASGARRLWHAWVDGYDEALPSRFATRGDALFWLLIECDDAPAAASQ